jgi:3-hydroxyisobutyrate dehydrogenase-like beta-hydroxyacid dehydrogenase
VAERGKSGSRLTHARELAFPTSLMDALSSSLRTEGSRIMTNQERFIHGENVKNFKKRLETATDEAQRKMLLKLLTEEQAKANQLVAKPKQST